MAAQTRSARRETRNPLLGLPACQQLLELDPRARQALRGILGDLARDANARADQAWRKSKGPMAAYWRAVSTYAKHTRAALGAAREGA